MDVVGIQLDTVWEDAPANMRRVRALLGNNPPADGTLIVLPEMYTGGFSMNPAALDEGTDRHGERLLGHIASAHRACVIGGVVTLNDPARLDHAAGGVVSACKGSLPRAVPPCSKAVVPHRSTAKRLYRTGQGLNQAVIYGDDGELIDRYTKMHPFTFAGEHEHYAPGQRVVTFTWQDAIIAPCICYDLRFPELFRRAAMQGACVFVVIANWPAARVEHWVTLNRARAIENQAYVIAINRSGSDPNVEYPGRSLVVDPLGQIIADAGPDEAVLQATIDLDMVTDIRRQFPALDDIRSDLLGDTT